MTVDFSSSELEQIKLNELIVLSYKKKFMILSIIGFITILSVAYAYILPEKWTVKTTLDMPEIADIDGYYQSIQAINLIAKLNGDDTRFASSINDNVTQVFTEFKKQLSSADTVRSFWRDRDNLKLIYPDINALSDDKVESVISNMVLIGFQYIDATKENNYMPRLFFSYKDPVIAGDIIRKYIEFTNKKVWVVKKKEFEVVRLAALNSLTESRKLLWEKVGLENENKLRLLDKAKYIAEKAGITGLDISGMQGNGGVVASDMLFFLGTKTLTAQIEKNSSKEIILPVELYKLDSLISKLNGLSILTETVNSYRYLQSPEIPAERDGPKRSIIILIGGIIGVLLSCIVLVFMAAKKKNV